MVIVENSSFLAFCYISVNIVHHVRGLPALFHSSVVGECSVIHGSETVMLAVNDICSSGCCSWFFTEQRLV